MSRSKIASSVLNNSKHLISLSSNTNNLLLEFKYCDFLQCSMCPASHRRSVLWDLVLRVLRGKSFLDYVQAAVFLLLAAKLASQLMV